METITNTKLLNDPRLIGIPRRKYAGRALGEDGEWVYSRITYYMPMYLIVMKRRDFERDGVSVKNVSYWG